jgi:hypothetical protein
MPLSIKARRQQGLSEVDRLSSEFKDWESEIKLPQYATQVESISSEVLTCAGRLRAALENLSASAGIGATYGECARIEKQIAWLWRAWDYFRAKFDQRRNPRFADTLQAADEVVWSCYRPFFKQPLSERVPDPAPLPYIEMEYSPVAVRRDQGAVIGGRPEHEELLAAAFANLPTPVLKLPVSAVENPWVIALTGHEAGHFVQRMISPNPLEFVGDFRRAIEDATGDAEWGSWAVEIFADWYSVLMLGQWAIHPIAQFGTGDTEANVARGGVYPSLLVRLELMAALADHYGFPGSRALDGLGLDRPAKGEFPQYDCDERAVTSVVQAIVKLPGCQEVTQQIGPREENFAAGGLANQWAKHVKNGDAQPETGKPDSARLVAAGSVEAWDEWVFSAPEPPKEDVLKGLRGRAIQAMKDAAMPGVRASSAKRVADDVLFGFLEDVVRV